MRFNQSTCKAILIFVGDVNVPCLSLITSNSSSFRSKTEIERVSVEQQTALISDGLTSTAAQAFLEQMPSAEALMPTLDMGQIKALSG